MIYVWATLLASGRVGAADIDVTEAPRFLLAGVAPNLVLTIDNSSSMGRAFMPDDVADALSIEPFASPDVNRLYYDPWKTYVPGLAADGTSLGHAEFSAANQFPYLGLDCYAPDPINLSEQYRVIKDDRQVSADCTDSIGYFNQDLPSGAAFYYLWDPGNYYSTDTIQKTDAQCNDAPFPPPQTIPQWAVCGAVAKISCPDQIAKARPGALQRSSSAARTMLMSVVRRPFSDFWCAKSVRAEFCQSHFRCRLHAAE